MYCSKRYQTENPKKVKKKSETDREQVPGGKDEKEL